MKIGLILECGPSGADKAVCEHLINMLDPEIEISTVTLSNKPGLFERCGKSALTLLETGCDRVVVVWDLYPAWRNDGVRPCLHEDRESLLATLRDAGVENDIYLVCITEELEAWLLADERALKSFLSRPTRRVRINRIKNPEQVSNPKTRLNKIMKEHTGRIYNDLLHAKQIVAHVQDFNRLQGCDSFKRFALMTANRDFNLRG